MSRVSYYYESPESLRIIEEPGLLCNYCGKLSTIERAEGSNLIPMPQTDMDIEYGHEEGNIHAHPKCALKAYKRMKKQLDQIEYELKKRKLI